MIHVLFDDLVPNDICIVYVRSDLIIKGPKVWAIVKIITNATYIGDVDKQECIVLQASFNVDEENTEKYIDRSEVVGIYKLDKAEQLLSIVTENL